MADLLEVERRFVQKVIDEIQQDGGTVLMVTRFGAHLYGTNTPDSDYDFMVVYLPDIRKASAGFQAKSYREGTNLSNSKNSAGDVDVQGVDVREVIKKFTKGEIVAIDLMFAHTNKKAVLYLHDAFQKFLDDYIYTGVIRPYGIAGVVGYINQQAQKYGVKGTRLGQVISLRDFVKETFDRDLPVSTVMDALKERPDILDGNFIKFTQVAVTKKGGVIEDDMALDVLGKVALPNSNVQQLLNMLEKHIEKYGHRAKQAMENEGIDWKAISHAFRAIYEYNSLVSTGMVRFPFPQEFSNKLVEIKKATRNFSEVKKELEHSLETIKNVNLGERIPDDVLASAIFSLWDKGLSEKDIDEFIASASPEEVEESLKVGVEDYLLGRRYTKGPKVEL